MIKLNIKPLSVNEAWQGKRFKTPKYSTYQNNMLNLLPNLNITKTDNFFLFVEFGYSSKLSDIDNGLKPLIDCLVKKYGFDDRYITELNVIKKLVNKGQEYIIFEIS